MVLGSARPLLQALQHATTEMLRWLVADYGFSERGASAVHGPGARVRDRQRRRSELHGGGQGAEGTAAAALIGAARASPHSGGVSAQAVHYLMATIAIGDIHGHLKPLCDLLERVRPNVGAGDTVVFLGDYIDRGSDTRACIDAILEFTATVTARVVALRGNHEDWLLRTMGDYTQHAWLLGMEADATIRSYAPDAADALRAAVRASRSSVFDGTCALPYEQFFDALPPAHAEFFNALALSHETAECFCSHGGVDPRAPLDDTVARTLVWGASGFPADYTGTRTVVYGHMNNAHVDEEDWPHPRIVGNTFGLDTIAHGVLSALRLPGPYVLQSARYQRRRQRGRP